MQLQAGVGLGTTVQRVDEMAWLAERQWQGQYNPPADPLDHGVHAGIRVGNDLWISRSHRRYLLRSCFR